MKRFPKISEKYLITNQTAGTLKTLPKEKYKPAFSLKKIGASTF
jgi:hypothetical protein